MRPILIVSGVLGGGTALVFVAAGLVATLFPSGALVPTNGWGGGMVRGGPAIRGGPVIIDDGTGVWQGGAQVIPLAPNVAPPMVDR